MSNDKYEKINYLGKRRFVLLELRDMLNGTCTENECPRNIAMDLYGLFVWDCADCTENFTWLLTKAHNLNSNQTLKSCVDLCPCLKTLVSDLSPEIIFLRLDEVIEEIQEEIDKEMYT